MYSELEIYPDFISNEDENNPNYELIPRAGAFEISINGFIIFSKLKLLFWPNDVHLRDVLRKAAFSAYNKQPIVPYIHR